MYAIIISWKERKRGFEMKIKINRKKVVLGILAIAIFFCSLAVVNGGYLKAGYSDFAYNNFSLSELKNGLLYSLLIVWAGLIPIVALLVLELTNIFKSGEQKRVAKIISFFIVSCLALLVLILVQFVNFNDDIAKKLFEDDNAKRGFAFFMNLVLVVLPLVAILAEFMIDDKEVFELKLHNVNGIKDDANKSVSEVEIDAEIASDLEEII